MQVVNSDLLGESGPGTSGKVCIFREELDLNVSVLNLISWLRGFMCRSGGDYCNPVM